MQHKWNIKMKTLKTVNESLLKNKTKTIWCRLVIQKQGGRKTDDQLEVVWKTSLESHVFSCLFNIHKERARQSSPWSWFHKAGATAKKTLPLVDDLWVSHRVATWKSLICDDLVGEAVDIGAGNVGSNCGRLCTWEPKPWTCSGTPQGASGGKPEVGWCNCICLHQLQVWLPHSGPAGVPRPALREAPCREL